MMEAKQEKRRRNLIYQFFFLFSLDARENAIGRDKVLEGSELGRRSRFRLETLPYSFKVGGGGSPYRTALLFMIAF